MSIADWTAVLDTFEARLDAQVEALARGDVEPIAAFAPPELSAPLPDQLIERATALVWRCREVEESLTAAVSNARTALDDADANSAAPRHSQPVYFDSRI